MSMYFCTALASGLLAQHFNIHNPLTLPDKSQQSEIRQRIGYTDITIAYHSPGAHGRDIWGVLVPYGRVWRAGANENTLFTITNDATIEGHLLPAGTYGMHVLPEEEQWTFIFSNDHTSWGSYFYDEQFDALRVTVPVEVAPERRDWMSFDFLDRSRGNTSIYLTWGDKRAGFRMEIDIDSLALDGIRKGLKSDAYWEWYSWCQAADYCVQYEINTEEAMEWIERSIALQENFSNLDVKAKLQRQLGNEEGAEETMARAVEVGTEIYLERYGRRLMAAGDYEEAERIFSEALKKNENYWRAHYNRGRALEALGRTDQAIAAMQEALHLSPENMKERIQQAMQDAGG